MMLIYITLLGVGALRLPEQRDDLPNQLIIVRALNPKNGMLERMKKMQDDLKGIPWANYIIALHNEHMTDHTVRDQIREARHQTAVYEWDTKQVRSAYQGIPAKFNAQTIGWQFHAESLFLSWLYAERHFNKTFDYIWHLEDDVYICGNFYTGIAQKYSQDNSDLIWRVGHLSTSRYPWKKMASDNFCTRYQKTEWADETVQRFSRRFLTRMEELARKENVTAVSEMFGPTTAANENFTQQEFRSQHILPIFSMGIRGKGEKELDKMCAEHPGGAGMAHHAKWIKDHPGIR